MLFWEKRIQVVLYNFFSATMSHMFLFMSSFFLYPADGVMSTNCELLLIDKAFDLPFALLLNLGGANYLNFKFGFRIPKRFHARILVYWIRQT